MRARGYVKLSYTDVDEKPQPGTDAALLEAGFACFTPLCTVCEAGAADTSGLEQMLMRTAS